MMAEKTDEIGVVLGILILVLGGVLAFGFIFRYILKKGWIRTSQGFTPHLSVLGEHRLDAKHRLVVVRFYDHDILVSLGDGVHVIDRYNRMDRDNYGN